MNTIRNSEKFRHLAGLIDQGLQHLLPVEVAWRAPEIEGSRDRGRGVLGPL